MVKLADLVAQTESANNQWAMRFEPHVYARVLDPATVERARKANRCSYKTAQVILATSWGLFQIMGFNLYSKALDTKLSVGQFMASPEAQRAALKLFLAGKFDADAEVPLGDDAWMLKFARFYNGPGAPVAYVAQLREEAKWLGAGA